MNIKLPEIKAETLWKAASVLFTIGGAIVTSQINKHNHEVTKKEMKEEIMKEIFNDQEHS
jgi:hypothetical protein